MATALANQISYRRAQAAASGGVFELFGRVVVSAGTEPGSRVNVTVPAGSGEDDLERALEYALQLGAERRGALGCWAEECPAPRWVAAAALGRGMQWGWTARWMVRSRGSRALTGASIPARPAAEAAEAVEGIAIRPLADAPENRADVPFVDARWARLVPLDRTTSVLGAFDGARMVGTVALHANRAAGSGAVFNLGVAASHERRGIGRALMRAALQLADDQALGTVTLNATDAGAGLYARLGFEDRGRGQTFWINSDMWGRRAPSARERAVARAVAMDAPHVPGTDGRRLPCNMTPMRLAAATRSRRAADALERQGVPLDAVSAWDLGWTGRAEDALRAGGLDAIDETDRATPLHVAVQRGDRELAALCLRLGARTDIKDETYASDALGWCEACGRPEIAQMIRDRNDSSTGQTSDS